MGRDPARVDAELVALVRERTRAAEDEVRAALAPLSPAEEKTLRRTLPGARVSLGPFGWADVARGVRAEIASARELSGYYALQAERDALAAMVKGGPAGRSLQASVSSPQLPVPVVGQPQEAEEENPPRAAARAATARPRTSRARSLRPAATNTRAAARAQELLGLFTYHRDAPLVARALGVSLTELNEELDALKIRRKAYRLTRGTDFDLPRATALSAAPGPTVRRRARREAPAEVPPPPSEQELQAAELKSVLAEVGPKRTLLMQRLGAATPLSDAALLARFRAAGLEREFALRERDLIKALWTRHHASEAKVAAEMATDAPELRRIARERGVLRELEAVRDRLRKDARRRKWPTDRIAQVLHEREALRGLGILEELEREVAVRTAVIWKTLSGKRDALELLGKKLRLTRDDAALLRRLLDLR